MAKVRELKAAIEDGRYDRGFARLYGGGAARLAQQRQRYLEAVESFAGIYGHEGDISLYSTPGRTEIGGNHTDHNNGIVMAAAIDLDIIAVVAKNRDNTIRVRSKGFDKADEVHLDSLVPQKSESGRSAALIRGVAAGIKQQGGTVGGFNAYTTSDVLKGSGLSSSAAFEVCLGTILNGEYNGAKFSPVALAIIGQFAENMYFEKPSGLMDQLACAVGGAITIDFENPQSPIVTQIPVDLAANALKLVITDTKGDHADLTDDYAAIRREMESVAAFFGKNVLRQVERTQFLANIAAVREKTGDRAVLRAIHYYEDCRRVEVLKSALLANDFGTFLATIVEGGHSSFELNQNAYSLNAPEHQGIPLALALSQMVLNGRGGWRLQGGGFAGTIQAFVPVDLVEQYDRVLGNVFGCGACHVLTIRAVGCTAVLPS